MIIIIVLYLQYCICNVGMFTYNYWLSKDKSGIFVKALKMKSIKNRDLVNIMLPFGVPQY